MSSIKPVGTGGVIALNLGAMWGAILRRDLKERRFLIEGAAFDRLLLKEVHGRVEFVRCSFEWVGAAAAGLDASFLDCDIDLLELGDFDYGSMIVDGETTLGGIVTTGAYAETEEEKLRLLQRYGVGGSRPGLGSTSESDLVVAARFYLDRIHRHLEYALLLEEDLRPPEGSKVNWPLKFGLGSWTSFVRALRDSGVASLDTSMSTSDRKKFRLRFRRAPKELATESGAQGSARRFWDLIREG